MYRLLIFDKCKTITLLFIHNNYNLYSILYDIKIIIDTHFIHIVVKMFDKVSKDAIYLKGFLKIFWIVKVGCNSINNFQHFKLNVKF